jgi:RNA polymerase sigma-70 factor (ECF subfamily)
MMATTAQRKRGRGFWPWGARGARPEGDDEFLRKIEQHRDEFYRFILRNVWDSGVADDVFAQGVLAAYENRHKYTPGTNFRAWMYRILLNKTYVANRETGRAFASLDATEAMQAVAPEPADHYDVIEDPEALLQTVGDEVYRAMRGLSTAQRTAMLLRGVERFSYQEIADIMEIPVGTVMTHLARGRRKLRQELGDYARKTGIIRFPRARIRDDGAARPSEGQGSTART